MSVVRNRTVIYRTDVLTTCAVVTFTVKVNYITSVDGMVIDLISQ